VAVVRPPLALGALVLVVAACGQKVTPVYDAGLSVEWRTAPSLPRGRVEGLAAAIGGKLWYIGGLDGIDPQHPKSVDWVDVYDPGTDAWTSGPALPPEAPKHHLAGAVSGDKLYVAGGFTTDPSGSFVPSSASYVFDGTTWKRIAEQPVARGAATAQAIGGLVYVVGGGLDEGAAGTDVYAYDTTKDEWSQRISMPTPRQDLASCVLGARMIVVGGWISTAKEQLGATQVYDPVQNAWTVTRDMPTPRGGLGATSIGDTCYAIGGEDWHVGVPGTLDVVEGFSFATSWNAFPSMPTARHGMGVASLGGRIYVVGGGTTRGDVGSDIVEVLDVSP
jgi:N-acetylneuraminic acid mutarotase